MTERTEQTDSNTDRKKSSTLLQYYRRASLLKIK